MATSKIAKPTGVATKYRYIGYIIGTSNTKNSGFYVINTALKLVELDLNLTTGAALSPGTTYAVGGITDAGIPFDTVRCDANRTDGGSAPATLEINTDGSVKLKPLASIPSGVNLRAHCMFFYQ